MGHNHDHAHHHHHAHAAPRSFTLAFALAVSLNLGFAGLESLYALTANSSSLLADAAHNFGDVLSLMLAWGANWLLTLPARKRYSYGYKRTSILAALANALILVAGSAIIAYESILKLWQLSAVNENIVMVVAGIGILVNGGTALLFIKGAHDDLNIKGAFLHLLSDAVIAIGVVVAGALVAWTGKTYIDPLVGLLIILIILWNTWGLLRNSLSLILDAVPHHIDLHGVRTYLAALPHIIAVHDLHIWGLSTKEVALTAHLVVPDNEAVKVDYKQINEELNTHYRIQHITLQVEVEGGDFICCARETC